MSVRFFGPGHAGSCDFEGFGMSGETLSIAEQVVQDARTMFRRQLLVEACLAVAGDMESYDYQIGRLIRKVESLVRSAQSVFGKNTLPIEHLALNACAMACLSPALEIHSSTK